MEDEPSLAKKEVALVVAEEPDDFPIYPTRQSSKLICENKRRNGGKELRSLEERQRIEAT